MSYFRRTGEHTFQATDHVSGAWDPDVQSLGL